MAEIIWTGQTNQKDIIMNTENVVYQISIAIDKEQELEWLQYMSVHIVNVLNTKCFLDFDVKKLVKDSTSSEPLRSEFIINYYAVSSKKMDEYLSKYSSDLQFDHEVHFGGHFEAKRTYYEDVSKSLWDYFEYPKSSFPPQKLKLEMP